MNITLANLIPFQPWYFVVIQYTAALSLFYLASSISLSLSARFNKNSSKSQLQCSISRSMLNLFYLPSAIFLVALAASFIQHPNISKHYPEWEVVNISFPLVSIATNIIAMLISFPLLRRTANMKLAFETSNTTAISHILAISFFTLVIGLPLWAAYLIGPNYELSKYLFYSCIFFSLLLIITSIFLKNLIFKCIMRWLSFALIATILLFQINLTVVAHAMLPAAQSYSAKLSIILEEYKAREGFYPLTLSEPPIRGTKRPHLVSKSTLAYYSCGENRMTYSLHIFQDPYISFIYSSETRKWSTWQSNLWY